MVWSAIVILHPLQGLGQQNSDASSAGHQHTPAERDGQHDFDFELGTWKTHLRRLVHPLTGSTTWVELDGTTVVRKVWNGGANLLELEADGAQGHFEGLNLRLYNPQSHQWSLNFANSNDGTLSQPTVGEFKNGRGEFYDQETLDVRAIFVRLGISDITADSCLFTSHNPIRGGSNRPPATAVPWARPRSANSRMDAASFSTQNHPALMAEPSWFDLFGRTSPRIPPTLNSRSRMMAAKPGKSTG